MTEINILGIDEDFEDEVNDLVATFVDWFNSINSSNIDDVSKTIVFDITLFAFMMNIDSDHLNEVFTDVMSQRGGLH